MDDDLWRVSWQITNRTRRSVQVRDSWLPHSLFRAERRVFEPALVLQAGEGRIITSLVRCSPRPGERIDNAFLILRVDGDAKWRVLAQVRVECERDDSISVVVEQVTAHPVGFVPAANAPGR